MSSNDTSSDPAAASDTFTIIPPTTGKVVSAVTWFLLVTSGLAVIARVLTKWAMTRRFNWDDGLAITSLVLNVAQGIAVSIQSAHGFGQLDSSSADNNMTVFLKASYAGQLLFILTICAAKMSIPVLLNNLTPEASHKVANKLVAGFIAVWTLASFFAVAFTCSPPTPYDFVAGKCYNRTSFWYAYSTIQIFTDLVLIAIPVAMVWPLHMTLRKKILVLCCFGCRLLDVVATAFQIRYTETLAVDNLGDSWRWILTAQIVTCITIVTTCIPYMRPLFAAFPSGMWMSDEIRRKGNTTGTGPAGSQARYATDSKQQAYILQPVQSKQSSPNSTAHRSMRKSGGGFDFGFAKGGVTTSVTADRRADPHDDKADLLQPRPAPDEVLITQSFSTRQSSIEKSV